MSSNISLKKQRVKKALVKKKAAKVQESKKQALVSKGRAKHNSDTEGSSFEDECLENYSTGGSDSLSCDSEDLSQDFSDEDKLMEYYEKKLREHCILGNIDPDSDTCEDEFSDKLKEFKLKSEEITKQHVTSLNSSQLIKMEAGSPKLDVRSGSSECVRRTSTLTCSTKRKEPAEKYATQRNVFKQVNRKAPFKSTKNCSISLVTPGIAPTTSSNEPKTISRVLTRTNQEKVEHRETVFGKSDPCDIIAKADILKNYVHNFSNGEKKKIKTIESALKNENQLKEEFVNQILKATLDDNGRNYPSKI